MPRRTLTGLERELVLQYLKDGNAPLTIASQNENEKDENNTQGLAVFPVAVSGKNMKVLEKGIIVLKDTTGNIQAFLNCNVNVQFYFNKLCLYFCAKMKQSMQRIYLQVPDEIFVKEDKSIAKTNVSGVLRFSGEENSSFLLKAQSLKDYCLFDMPKWKDIEIENQKKAKQYLEDFIRKSKNQDIKLSNGVHLLSICRYFLEDSQKQKAVSVDSPLDILFIDSMKVVFGRKNCMIELQEKEKYMLQLYIETGIPSLPQRQIFASCKVEKIYSAVDLPFYCAVCYFEDLKEEDKRFLWEKFTGNIFE